MLTEDMTRLCDEIVAMRKMRGSHDDRVAARRQGAEAQLLPSCARTSAVSRDHGETDQERTPGFSEQPEALGWRAAARDEKRPGRRPQGLGRQELSSGNRWGPKLKRAGAIGPTAIVVPVRGPPAGSPRGWPKALESGLPPAAFRNVPWGLGRKKRRVRWKSTVLVAGLRWI